MGAMTSLWPMAKHPETFAAGLIIAGQQRPADVAALAAQNVLIITGAEDNKATPWSEKCVPVWEKAGARITRPTERLGQALNFPVDRQEKLADQTARLARLARPISPASTSTLSSPERAILELLDGIPQREGFEQADRLVGALTNLSPRNCKTAPA